MRRATALDKMRSTTIRARLQVQLDTVEDGQSSTRAWGTGTGDGSRGRMRVRYVEAGHHVPGRRREVARGGGGRRDCGAGAGGWRPRNTPAWLLDLDKVADQANESPQAASLRRLIARGDASVTLGAWVTHEERPVRLRVSTRIARPGGGRPQTALIELLVDEFDVDVDASPPPEALVTDDSLLD